MNHEFDCPWCGKPIKALRGETTVPEWIRHGDGWGWRYDGRTIVAEHPPQPEAGLDYIEAEDGGYVYRTAGYPKTMERTLSDYYNDLYEAGAQYGLWIEDIMAVLAIEARRNPDRSWDVTSVREESGFKSDLETPHRVSAGLMQTLLSTYMDMEPRIPMAPLESVTRYGLFQPRRSILSGSAYMEDRFAKYPDRVMAYVAAYNAGGVYSADNVWNLRTYSPHRIDRFMAWVNDAVDLLS